MTLQVRVRVCECVSVRTRHGARPDAAATGAARKRGIQRPGRTSTGTRARRCDCRGESGAGMISPIRRAGRIGCGTVPLRPRERKPSNSEVMRCRRHA